MRLGSAWESCKGLGGSACAGTGRGAVNDAGRVANEVEIEQVVDAGFDWRTGFPLLASLVQVRLQRVCCGRIAPKSRHLQWRPRCTS